MTELLALAERVEKAEGADIGGDLTLVRLEDEVKTALWSQFHIAPRPFLHSLDAAMTLVPEGCFYGFLMDGDGGGFIACCQFAGPDQAPPELLWIKAATPALALTAAALRARSA